MFWILWCKTSCSDAVQMIITFRYPQDLRTFCIGAANSYQGSKSIGRQPPWALQNNSHTRHHERKCKNASERAQCQYCRWGVDLKATVFSCFSGRLSVTTDNWDSAKWEPMKAAPFRKTMNMCLLKDVALPNLRTQFAKRRDFLHQPWRKKKSEDR